MFLRLKNGIYIKTDSLKAHHVIPKQIQGICKAPIGHRKRL